MVIRILKILLFFSILFPQNLQTDNFIIKFQLEEIPDLHYTNKDGYFFSNHKFDAAFNNNDILKIEKMYVEEIGELGCYYRAWLKNPNSEIENVVEIFNNIECIEFAKTEIQGQLLQQNHPNDPLYNFSLNGGNGMQEQWHLYNDGDMNDDGILDGLFRADIHAPEAWVLQTGRDDVLLSISDSGIMWDHPDLAGQIWINALEDGNGNNNFDPSPLNAGGDFGDVNNDGCPGDCNVDDDNDGLSDFQDIGVIEIYTNMLDDDNDGSWEDGNGYQFNDSPGIIGLDDDADVTARFPEFRNQASQELQWWFYDFDNDGWWDIGEPRPCDPEINECNGLQVPPNAHIIKARGLIRTDEFDNVYIDDYDGAKFDDDENGYVDDVIGWDFKNLDPIPEDLIGHGTSVSGDMISIGNNNLFNTGVMWNGKIMTTKIGDNHNGLVRQSEAIYYCARNNARIHNMSWSGSHSETALDFAYNEKNVLLISAAGNQGDNFIPFPAADENVITVAGLNSFDEKHPSSNYGTEVELCAAYEPLTILWNNGQAAFFGSGTSHSSPIVAGVGGLIISELLDNGNQNYTNIEVRNILNSTANNISSENQGLSWEYLLGNGRVNAYKALSLANGPPDTPGNFYGTGTHGNNPTLYWDNISEADIEYLELKRTTIGQPGGNHTFILQASETQFTDATIIIDKYSQVIIKYELRSVDVANLNSAFTHPYSFSGEGLWKESSTLINYDTLFYYNRDNLLDTYLGFTADIDDGGTLFTVDSSLNFNIQNIKFSIQSNFHRNWPYDFTFYIKQSLNDTTPGELIKSYTFTIIDSTYLFPNWFSLRLDTIPELQNIIGDFWITRSILLTDGVHDGYNDPSGHSFLHGQSGWYSVDFDIALEVVIEEVSAEINDPNENIPESLFIIGNYPNPFNSNTKIALHIKNYSNVSFSIYDINGLRIYNKNIALSPGEHFLKWDGKNIFNSDVGSGVYLYTIQHISKGLVINKKGKMVLLR
ncbi:MAG: S8 family peptidase [Candidatus Marinimicrobia bacterium]|nr:S8 family peptidase [Candidatus Neomarinimicrobiota bacterium]